MNPQVILQKLPAASLKILEVASEATGGTVYLVGGILRDVFLDVPILDNDLDFVVEGNTQNVAEYIQNRLGGTLTSHSEFGAFTLKTQAFTIDITTARKETYKHPGALPTVEFSDIWHDLARRDFSINTLALKLRPLELLDPHHGLDDLQDKTLRNLHSASFLDDPTRVLRGARLAGRLRLNWEKETWAKIAETLSSRAITNISRDRLKAELELCLSETRVAPVLEELERCGILECYFALSYNPDPVKQLDLYRQHYLIPDESYLLSMLIALGESSLESFLEGFHYPMRYIESVKRVKTGLVNVNSSLFPRLNPSETWLLKAMHPAIAQRIRDLEQVFSERRLTGQDVLDLGLLSGPKVGTILAQVAQARDQGQVSGYEQELELARTLVLALQENK